MLMGGQQVNQIAGWDGQSWHAMGSGTIGAVQALATFGGSLYASGQFASVDRMPGRRIARWDVNVTAL